MLRSFTFSSCLKLLQKNNHKKAVKKLFSSCGMSGRGGHGYDNNQDRDNYRPNWRGNRGGRGGHRGHRGHRHGQGYHTGDNDGNGWQPRNERRPYNDNDGDMMGEQQGGACGWDRSNRGGRPRSGGRGGEGGGNRPPPGLKGKDIGLWYAARSKGKTKEKEKTLRPNISIGEDKERNLIQLIARMRQERQETQRATTYKPEKEENNDDLMCGPDMEEEFMESEWTELDQFKRVSKDTEFDESLVSEQKSLQHSRKYKAMKDFREQLPCFKEKEKILDLIRSNQVVVLSGATGCGKTTQVPQYILDDCLERARCSECHIICTQPRRICAISVAERVSEERGEVCGRSVGYKIRLEHKLPRDNASILYCTTGILLKKLEDDSDLQQASHIILDEIHERDILTDFMLIVIKDIIKRRSDLKVILMSATLNAEQFSEYFDNCPMIHIPGFTYPVTEYRLEDVYELLNYRPAMDNQKKGYRGRKHWKREQEESEIEQAWPVWIRNLEGERKYSRQTIESLAITDPKAVDAELIKQLIRYIVQNKRDGAILVFVPGWTDIRNVNNAITGDTFFQSSMFKIIPLHSMMPTIHQKDIFSKSPEGVRKIVIATNIAETSITIEDVVYVIDSGKTKMTTFSAEKNLVSLEPVLVAKANAKQRKGRAGRVQPGECYHLYTGLEESYMEDHLPPEILRTPLEEICLKIKLLKLGEILPFIKKALQPPSIVALELAIRNLQEMNALDKDEILLPLGKHLARLPLEPHTGKMILFGALFGCLEPSLIIASALDFKDPFLCPLGKEQEADNAKRTLADGCNSDHILLVNTYQRWVEARNFSEERSFCWRNFISEPTIKMLDKMKNQLERYLLELGFLKGNAHRMANENSENTELVKAIVCAGLYPQIAKLPTRKRFFTKDKASCELIKGSVFKKEGDGVQWVVFHEKKKLQSGVVIFDSSAVNPYALMLFGGEMTHIEEEEESLVCIDDWIKFKASASTIKLFKAIREELNIILDQQVTQVSQALANPRSPEYTLIKGIIELITNTSYTPCGYRYENRNDHRNDRRNDFRNDHGRQNNRRDWYDD